MVANELRISFVFEEFMFMLLSLVHVCTSSKASCMNEGPCIVLVVLIISLGVV